MADEKKPQKTITDEDAATEIIFILGLLLFLGLISTAITNLIQGSGVIGASGGLWSRISEYFLARIWPIWKGVALVITGVAGFGIVHNFWKLGTIAAAEAAIFGSAAGAAGASTGAAAGAFAGERKSDRWEKILAHANSNNPSDWRWAIIEADIFLEESLKAKGFMGDNLGEILKSMTKGDLSSLDAAWDAHKVRNRIAHDGDKFDLNEREVKRVILLFEAVLKELKVI